MKLNEQEVSCHQIQIGGMADTCALERKGLVSHHVTYSQLHPQKQGRFSIVKKHLGVIKQDGGVGDTSLCPSSNKTTIRLLSMKENSPGMAQQSN